MKKFFPLLLFILLAFLPGIFGSFFSPGEWYGNLLKPSFTPPGWLFGPVWTLLYIMIGIAGYFVWTVKDHSLQKSAFIIYAIQLFFNGIWSWIFFGLHKIDLALLVILILWIFIIFNIFYFYKIKKLSGYLLIPYLLWVSFASILNASIWSLN